MQLYPSRFKVPVMLGAGFAIRRDYFSDLGQYDDGEFSSNQILEIISIPFAL